MIKWLRVKIRNWLSKHDNIDYLEPAERGISLSKQAMRSKLAERGLNFTLYKASNGGYVVEYNSYDEKSSRHYNSLHIIPTDENLGDSIAQIITIELLRS